MTISLNPPAIWAGPAAAPVRYAPLYWLALGSFAIGTEGFMIAAILPKIADDLAVSLQSAGQLVTIFSLTYALSSPVLTALTGSLNRRTLLISAMTAFTAANLIAAVASGYGALVAARILLALSAGLYVPNANALAGALVPPARRGRALAIVGGGVSLAVALGVPLGAVIGAYFGWRMTFIGVAALASIALTGLLIGMPRGIGDGLATTSLRQRAEIIGQRGVLPALLVTTLWATGGYTAYTYIAPFAARVLGLDGGQVGYLLFLWGIGAFAGLQLGGWANDRFGGRRVIAIVLPIMAAALISLSVFAAWLSPAGALIPVLGVMLIWGMTGWGFFSAQQARLIGLTGLAAAPIILSLNASFMYLGFSLGACLGSVTLTLGSAVDLGWVGGLLVLLAMGLFLLTHRRIAAQA